MIILAVDLGARRLGFAICDAEERVASPLQMVEVSSPAEALEAVCHVARETSATRIVVGEPRRLDGRAGRASRLAGAFAEKLRSRGFETVLWDERLSSAEADSALRLVQMPRKKRSQRLDAIAAQRILASYLEMRRRELARNQKRE